VKINPVLAKPMTTNRLGTNGIFSFQDRKETETVLSARPHCQFAELLEGISKNKLAKRSMGRTN